jgi:hypothetical protein
MAKNKPSLAMDIEREGETVASGAPVVTFLGAQPDPTLVTNQRLVNDIAKSAYVVRNLNFPESKIAFQFSPEHQTIDRYFPLADGGPLYVDTSIDTKKDTDKNFIEATDVKRKIMKRHKLRYLVLFKDSDMVEVEQQLQGQA